MLLRGKRIPIHARIVALADVFDALTHGRPYAPAWPIERALEEIQARRGTQFDPELTDRFIKPAHQTNCSVDGHDSLAKRFGLHNNVSCAWRDQMMVDRWRVIV